MLAHVYGEVDQEMDLSDFRIGGEFTTADGRRRWRCTDIGTRTVAAIRIDEVEMATLVPGNPVATRIVPGAEAEAEGFFIGPPYKVAEHLFDEDDREGCEPV
ncbi:hypothetical protein ACLBYF_04150 [Methylobacterium brachiatum]